MAWYHDVVLRDATLPYLDSRPAECAGETNPLDPVVGNVLVDDGIVVASLNYVSQTTSSNCRRWGCRKAAYSQSLMLSVTDTGESYQLNFAKGTLPLFQAVVYASPNFLRSRCDPTAAPPPPSVWVSWIVNGTSSLQNIDIKMGNIISKIDISDLKDITLTSKMSIFYNDQVMECDGFEDKDTMLVPLVFGYGTAKGEHEVDGEDF